MRINFKFQINVGTRTEVANFKLQSGQALVTLLVVVAIASTIIGAAVAVTIVNSQTTSKFALAEEALSVAETGAETAIIKILRSPDASYLGETQTIGNGSAQITVSYALPSVTVVSKGQVGNFVRKIQVTGTYQGNKFTVLLYDQID